MTRLDKIYMLLEIEYGSENLSHHIQIFDNLKMFVNDNRILNKSDSIWWRGLILINDCEGTRDLSASDLFSCRVKKGDRLSFWFCRWCGEQALSETYPELYTRATTPFMYVADAGHWENDEWIWNSQNWFSIIDEDDQYLFLELLDLISSIQLVQGERYTILWAANESEGFSVNSCAKAVRSRMETVNGEEVISNKLKFLWHIEAPSKVQIFVWRIVLDRNPTRQQQKKRGILTAASDCCCVFCVNTEEDSHHLFVSCPILEKIWEKVGSWIGNSISLTNLGLRNYLAFYGRINVLDERLTVGVIWMSVVWNIWIMRNAIIFRGRIFSFDECVSAIVLSSWKWFRAVNVSSVSWPPPIKGFARLEIQVRHTKINTVDGLVSGVVVALLRFKFYLMHVVIVVIVLLSSQLQTMEKGSVTGIELAST
ncbi:uncharacterized protein LOC131636112 [Vicia villosa]|uniref:uncharacterized protein LOC131636112 n=1 Tax=Vicia villosa TaxID=3911 RepID=UPI00273C48E1|nr:uncharacterized protein LOC131636112 [Vicia villosa]